MPQEESTAENKSIPVVKKEPEPQVKGEEKTNRNLALKLALIEHGSRPLVNLLIGLFVIILLFWAKDPLFNLLSRAQELKVGSFEIQLRDEAEVANLSLELRTLRKVTPDQLALFLVIGRQREQIVYNGPEVTEENLEALEKASLLSSLERLPDGRFSWQVSEQGNRLYEIISAQLQLAINRSASQ
jgi:hypothetical protein